MDLIGLCHLLRLAGGVSRPSGVASLHIFLDTSAGKWAEMQFPLPRGPPCSGVVCRHPPVSGELPVCEPLQYKRKQTKTDVCCSCQVSFLHFRNHSTSTGRVLLISFRWWLSALHHVGPPKPGFSTQVSVSALQPSHSQCGTSFSMCKKKSSWTPSVPGNIKGPIAPTVLGYLLLAGWLFFRHGSLLFGHNETIRVVTDFKETKLIFIQNTTNYCKYFMSHFLWMYKVMRLQGHLEDLIGVVCVAGATSLGFHPILSCFGF